LDKENIANGDGDDGHSNGDNSGDDSHVKKISKRGWICEETKTFC
jgi:hypothetical protein